MEDDYNPYSRDLRAFRRHHRQPSTDSQLTESLNVYNHSRTISLNSFSTLNLKTNSFDSRISNKTLASSNLSEKKQTLSTSLTQSSNVSNKKSLKLTKPIQIEKQGHEKLVKTAQHSIFKKRQMNMDNLVKQCSKESILFNQVKSLVSQNKNRKGTQGVSSLELKFSEKMIDIRNLRKLSTIKKSMLSTNSEPVEVPAEAPNTVQVPVIKRKQLKQNKWRWVAAGGHEVY